MSNQESDPDLFKPRMPEVDYRVAQHHQRISDGGVDDFSFGTEVRPCKHEVTANAVGDRADQKIRSEFSPARVCAVGDEAHDHIIKRAKGPHRREQPEQRRRGNGPNVHVIVGEKNVECLEEEPGSRVAKCVADVFDWLETVAVGRSRLRLLVRHLLAAKLWYLLASLL